MKRMSSTITELHNNYFKHEVENKCFHSSPRFMIPNSDSFETHKRHFNRIEIKIKFTHGFIRFTEKLMWKFSLLFLCAEGEADVAVILVEEQISRNKREGR